MVFGDKISLNDKDKRRISLILHGTAESPGCRISHLDFGSKETRDHEITRFIRLVNLNFHGLFTLMRTDDFIVPVISNRGTMGHSFNNIGGPAVALSCLILFHYFEFDRGPTLANLNTKSEGTPLHGKINSIIKDLKNQRWIKEEKEQKIVYFTPTEILFACISFETLKRVYSIIYNDKEERPKLIRFLSKDYLKVQQQLGVKLSMSTTQSTLINYKAKKENEDEQSL